MSFIYNKNLWKVTKPWIYGKHSEYPIYCMDIK